VEHDDNSFQFTSGSNAWNGTFFFTADAASNLSDLFNGIFNTPPRPKIEVVTIILPNGVKMEVPLKNAEVDDFIDRSKEYRRRQEEERRREEHKRRQEAEEARRREQDYQQRRRQQEYDAKRHWEHQNPFVNGGYGYDYGPGSSRYAGRDDGIQSNPAKPSMSTDVLINQLTKFAKLTPENAKQLTLKQLWRRAQRACHPDSGGTHEAWLELHKLEIYIVK
jgi:hypothetical protein